MNDDSSITNDRRVLWFTGAVAIAYMAVWAVILARNPDDTAFNGVSAFFSGAAFFGVIVAILLQREELGLQRKELEQTREELKGQKEQLALQNETFTKQGFESTFFQMLSLHREIVKSMDVREGGLERHASDCFIKFYGSIRQKLTNEDMKKYRPEFPRDGMERAYADVSSTLSFAASPNHPTADATRDP